MSEGQVVNTIIRIKTGREEWKDLAVNVHVPCFQKLHHRNSREELGDAGCIYILVNGKIDLPVRCCPGNTKVISPCEIAILPDHSRSL